MHAYSVAQSCPTLWDPMDCSPPGSSVHARLGKNTGVGCHALLQGIFPTQGSNLRLLLGRQILYHEGYLGSCLKKQLYSGFFFKKATTLSDTLGEAVS